MLYERWLQTVDAYAREVAVWDAASGGRWTFRQLADAVEKLPRQTAPVICRGQDVAFLLAVLNAWRDGVPLVPVESAGPGARLLQGLPPWVGHIKMTSGSTGSPKLVLFRQEQLAADADAIVATMGLCREQPNIGVVSLAHSYGFSNLVTPLLMHGIPLVFVDNALPEVVRKAIADHSAVTLPGVPAMWRAWFRSGVPSSKIRLAISAGAPLQAEFEREVFRETGLKIHNFYGASECGGIAYDTSLVPREDPSFVGVPLQGVSVSVADSGCLEIRGAAVGECYWPERSTALEEGCCRTEDLGEISSTGLRLLGRAGDIINVAGRKIDPAEIEAAISTASGVLQCVVFGVPSSDPDRVDDIAAVLSLRKDAVLTVVKKEAAAHLEGWQIPRIWGVDDTLCPDVRGKISRAHWRGRYLEKRICQA